MTGAAVTPTALVLYHDSPPAASGWAFFVRLSFLSQCGDQDCVVSLRDSTATFMSALFGANGMNQCLSVPHPNATEP